MSYGYIAENWEDGLNLADGYLEAFIERYRNKDGVGIFLLGHAIELYVKCLYWKVCGQPKNKTHNIRKILEEISNCNNAINIILNDVKNSKPLSQLDLIYNGHLADLKYLNMTHNKLEKLEFNQYCIEFEQSKVLFKHLSIIFQLLDKDQNNSERFMNLIKELDKNIKDGKKVFIADMEIVCFLRMCLIPDYKPQAHKTIFGEVFY